VQTATPLEIVMSYSLRQLLALALVIVSPASSALAQEAADKKEGQKEAAKNTKEDGEKKADRYTVPKGADVKGLVKFINDLVRFRPTNALEAQLHRRRLPDALKQAAGQIVTKEKDQQSVAFGMGKGILFEIKIHGLSEAKSEGQKKLIDEMLAYYKVRKNLGGYEFQIGRLAASQLEQLGSKHAAYAFKSFGSVFAKHKAPQIAAQAQGLLGAARRLEVPGKAMEVTGKTVAGKEFDLKSMKGKVVLVDFWATWCGPCVAEYPNMLRQYEKYHEKGFEIVGISLDQSRFKLEQYIQQKKVPWVNLHEADGSGQHPVAVKYGIFSIPRMILINREGNVISLQARGEELAELLAKEFAAKKPKK